MRDDDDMDPGSSGPDSPSSRPPDPAFSDPAPPPPPPPTPDPAPAAQSLWDRIKAAIGL
jgi:hypothetical protein